MFATGLLVGVLLALHGLAASSVISAAPCCKTNITIAITSTITTTCLEKTVFANGSHTITPSIPKTSEYMTPITFASGSHSTHHSLGSTLYTAVNVTVTDADRSMPAISLSSVTLVSPVTPTVLY